MMIKYSNVQIPPVEMFFWVVLFLLHFGGIAAIIAVGLSKDVPNQEDYSGMLPYDFTAGGELSSIVHYIEMVAILICVSLVVSFLYIQLMKRFTAALIYIGMGFSLLSFFALAIYYGTFGNIVGAVIMGIFTLLLAFYYFTIRSRIPFAVEMIKNVTDTITQYPATQAVSYVSIIVQTGWVCLWVFALFVSQRFEQKLTIVAFVFLLFSLYWVSEVIKNVVHVTVSGVFASVYFLGDQINAFPTLGALKRSLTTSFGSICLGSLVVSLIKTIRSLVRMARSEQNSILLCLADCILGCIDSLVQYFNHYAFCQVAIYGKTFIEAAKSTWHLIQTSGLEAIANDNLIDGVLWVGVLFNAILTGAVGIGVSYLFDSTLDDALPMFILGFVIGFIIMILGMQVVDSGIACTFVCFAEDREVLHRTNPVLYQKLVETYHLQW